VKQCLPKELVVCSLAFDTVRAAAAVLVTCYYYLLLVTGSKRKKQGVSTQFPGVLVAPPRSQVPSNVIKRAHATRLGRPLGH
jgi:hypothetical protein